MSNLTMHLKRASKVGGIIDVGGPGCSCHTGTATIVDGQCKCVGYMARLPRFDPNTHYINPVWPYSSQILTGNFTVGGLAVNDDSAPVTLAATGNSIMAFIMNNKVLVGAAVAGGLYLMTKKK